MNIAQIKQLDVGMSGISCSGEVTWTGKSKNLIGTTDGRDYNFWSLFIVIRDATDKIGIQLSAESEFSIPVGSRVVIEKAQLQSYVKDGNTNLKLVGKLAVKQQQPAPQNAPQAPSQPAGQATKTSDTNNYDMVKIRSMALSYAKDMVCNGMLQTENFEQIVGDFTAFIMTGRWLGKDKKALAAADGIPIDDDIPF